MLKLPPILYKYFHNDRADLFSRGLIRFSRALSFNDPFEVLPRCDRYLSDHLRDLVTKDWIFSGASERVSYRQFSRIVTHKKDVIKTAVMHSHLFQEDANNEWAFLCFTERLDSLLMWAHYANSHQGFVVAFKTGHEFFTKRVVPVVYCNDRPHADAPNPVAVFNTKTPEWNYEKEWRIIMDARKQKTPFTEPMPADCIAAVYLGARMNPSSRVEISRGLSKTTYAHVERWQMALHPSEFQLVPQQWMESETSDATWLGEGI